MSNIGLPLQPLAAPSTRSLPSASWAIPPLSSDRLRQEPSGADALDQIAEWGFTLLPGVIPRSIEGACLWFHPAGLLVIGGPDPDLAPVAAAPQGPTWLTVLASLDMGLYLGDKDVLGANGSLPWLETHATLNRDVDGTHYQHIRGVCQVSDFPRLLATLQSLGRLAGFESTVRLGRRYGWKGLDAFDRSAIQTWPSDTENVQSGLPPDLPPLLGWIRDGAPMAAVHKRATQARRGSALTMLLENIGKGRGRRYPSARSATHQRQWANQVAGMEAAPALDFEVLESGLTQAACWACAWEEPLPAGLLAWVSEAPLSALQAAIRGNPPAVPPLPSLMLHTLTHLHEESENWGVIASVAPAVMERLASRSIAAMQEQWAQASPWQSAFPHGLVAPQLGQVLAGMAQACQRAGAPWPPPTPAEERRWRKLPPAFVSLIEAIQRTQALEQALPPVVTKALRRL